MSRQRIRTGVLEGSTVVCPHCAGAGVVRSTASVALHVLRVVEDALIKSASHDIIVRARTEVALYILNQKRAHLRDIERRFGVNVTVGADDSLTGSVYHAMERGEAATGVKAPAGALDYAADPAGLASIEVEDENNVAVEEDDEELAGGEIAAEETESSERPAPQRAERGELAGEEGEGGRRRRRRRRRRGSERGPSDASLSSDSPQPTDAGLEILAEIGGDFPTPAPRASNDDPVSGDARERSRRPRRHREHDPLPAQADGGEAAEDSSPSGAADERPVDLPPMGFAGEPKADDAEPDTVKPASHEGSEPTPDARTTRASQPKPPEPAAEDPSRPRRSGWWQRAKASLVGD
jgi:ribonuclease E